MKHDSNRRTRVPRLHLNVGPTRPVTFVVDRGLIESGEIDATVDALRTLESDRDSVWESRAQVCLLVEGYNHDNRELIDIIEVREFFAGLCLHWPAWAYFLSRVDNSIPLLLSCSACEVAWGGGQFTLSQPRLLRTLNLGFQHINLLFDRYGFDPSENTALTRSIPRVLKEAWG